SANGALRYGAWRIDFARHAAQPIDDPDAGSLSDPDATVRLSPREIAILKLFAARPGEVISRATFLEEAWGLPGNLETRTVDNFIRRLRQHFEPDPASPRHILSVRGVGYRFEP
ncbi:MAG: winged helix-turn-helix domain-containing protein, partial [Acidobacteriota bacterium]